MAEGTWQDDENDAIVADYFAMLAKELAGQPFSKTAHRRTLQDRIGRGEERPVFDMPGEGMRYTRDSVGVEAVLVNGELAWTPAGYTAAKAGRICERV